MPSAKPAPSKEQAPKPAEKQDGPICGECFPAGWPSKDAVSGGCQHGEWVR